MRYSLTLWSILLLLFCGSTQANTYQMPSSKGNTYDGPYVFYKGDSIIVKNVDTKNGVPSVTVKKYGVKDRNKIKLDIRFSDQPEHDFSVSLNPILTNEPCIWPQPKKILALSDIEGEFEALRKLLLAAKVIDKQYNWLFGNGHVVLCGDLFDRGKEVPATIWLLYKLEQEAKKKGGYFHVLLGNHDIMNMSGDLRYLDVKYQENAKLLGEDYMELYNRETEAGRWLRTKNLIEKIGDNLCVHGGISTEINALKMSLPDINNQCRPYYDLGKKHIPEENEIRKFFSSKTSVFWFRGYFKEPVVDERVVDSTLRLYEVNRIIVGHTITSDNIRFYYHNKVLGVDVDHHKGKHEAALYQDNRWYKMDVTGKLSTL